MTIMVRFAPEKALQGNPIMSTEPIRYGVVGLGRAGWAIHVAGLRGRSDAKIVAVVDPVDERRKEAENEFGCKSYKTLS